jgi:hypothetical protein
MLFTVSYRVNLTHFQCQGYPDIPDHLVRNRYNQGKIVILNYDFRVNYPLVREKYDVCSLLLSEIRS